MYAWQKLCPAILVAMTDGYWDARGAAEALRDESLWITYYERFQKVGAPESYLKGRWDDRNWLNVPGPFYGAETDSCLAGIGQAPGHVLTDERGQEFVWRQPRDMDELRNVLSAAYQDPFDGYAWDGDTHWTPASVRAWWEQRARVSDWVERSLETETRDQLGTGRSVVLQAYRDYLHGDLERDLEAYVDWLDERRSS